MVGIVQTYKKIVRPNVEKVKNPNSLEEETTSIEEVTSFGENILGDFKDIGFSKSSGDSEALFNYTFGAKLLQDEGVVVSRASPNLSAIDYSELPLFKSIVGEARLRVLLRAYPSAEVTTSTGFRSTSQQRFLLKVGW